MANRLPAVLTILAMASQSPGLAERLRFDSFRQGQYEVSLSTASGRSHRIPSEVSERVRFDQLKLRVGQFISPRSELAGEFAALTLNGDPDNHGWSASACGRYYLSIRGSTAIACDLSIGITRFERRPIAETTRINFTDQLGFTVQYGIGPSTALTLEYKFSHNSNAGLQVPNLGLNASIFSIGCSWYP